MVGYQRFETMWTGSLLPTLRMQHFLHHISTISSNVGAPLLNVQSKSVCVSPRFQRWGSFSTGTFVSILGVPFRNNLVKPSQLPQLEEQARQRLFEEGEAKGLWGPPVGISCQQICESTCFEATYFFPANQWVVDGSSFLSHRLRCSWAFVCVFFIHVTCCENRWSYLPMSIDMSLYNIEHIEPRLPTSQLLFRYPLSQYCYHIYLYIHILTLSYTVLILPSCQLFFNRSAVPPFSVIGSRQRYVNKSGAIPEFLVKKPTCTWDFFSNWTTI